MSGFRNFLQGAGSVAAGVNGFYMGQQEQENRERELFEQALRITQLHQNIDNSRAQAMRQAFDSKRSRARDRFAAGDYAGADALMREAEKEANEPSPEFSGGKRRVLLPEPQKPGPFTLSDPKPLYDGLLVPGLKELREAANQRLDGMPTTLQGTNNLSLTQSLDGSPPQLNPALAEMSMSPWLLPGQKSVTESIPVDLANNPQPQQIRNIAGRVGASVPETRYMETKDGLLKLTPGYPGQKDTVENAFPFTPSKPAAGRITFQELPIKGVLHKVAVDETGKIVTDYGAIPEKARSSGGSDDGYHRTRDRERDDYRAERDYEEALSRWSRGRYEAEEEARNLVLRSRGGNPEDAEAAARAAGARYEQLVPKPERYGRSAGSKDKPKNPPKGPKPGGKPAPKPAAANAVPYYLQAPARQPTTLDPYLPQVKDPRVNQARSLLNKHLNRAPLSDED